MLRAGALALIAASAVSPAQADGGRVVAAGAAGPFELTVLVSRPELQVGTSDWSVVVRDPQTGGPCLDCEVQVRLSTLDGDGDGDKHEDKPEEKVTHARHPSGSIGAHALRTTSRNQAFHTARITLLSPGEFIADVRVRGPEGEGSLAFPVAVSPASSALASHWRALALPVLMLGFFLLHPSRGVAKSR